MAKKRKRSEPRNSPAALREKFIYERIYPNAQRGNPQTIIAITLTINTIYKTLDYELKTLD
jgi:hypothetical protein